LLAQRDGSGVQRRHARTTGSRPESPPKRRHSGSPDVTPLRDPGAHWTSRPASLPASPMKKRLLCCLLLLPVLCLGLEETEIETLAPADLGLKKLVFTAQPDHVLIYSLRVSRNGKIVSDEQAAQASAETNAITYFTGRPPWSEGPMFQLHGIGYVAAGYSMTGATGGDEDNGDKV